MKVVTSGMTGPVVDLNWCSNMSANNSNFSTSLYKRPFGPISGWTARVFLRSFFYLTCILNHLRRPVYRGSYPIRQRGVF